MTEKIVEYINKNLPNLNWNILPQIFGESEVELTEEIKTYLKNTPWNTNLNIFKNFLNENSSESLLSLYLTIDPQNSHSFLIDTDLSDSQLTTYEAVNNFFNTEYPIISGNESTRYDNYSNDSIPFEKKVNIYYKMGEDSTTPNYTELTYENIQNMNRLDYNEPLITGITLGLSFATLGFQPDGINITWDDDM